VENPSAPSSREAKPDQKCQSDHPLEKRVFAPALEHGNQSNKE
jgi:hypothetical protein